MRNGCLILKYWIKALVDRLFVLLISRKGTAAF